MIFLSDIEIDYNGDIRIIRDDLKKEKTTKKESKRKQKKDNKKMFSKLASKTAGYKKMSPIEVETIKSIVRAGQSRHSRSFDKQKTYYKKRIGINNTKSFRRNG